MALFLIIVAVILATQLPSGESGNPSAALHPGLRADPKCPLSETGTAIGSTLPSTCHVIASDDASDADPHDFWGQIACQSDSRVDRLDGGGDTHPSADGSPSDDGDYRRLTVIDGDDFYGERCELGENDHDDGPTVFYGEGKRRVTYVSIRLRSDFPLAVHDWQNVIQMKQTQPSDNGGGTPVLSLKAFDDQWILFHSDPGEPGEDFEIWSTPAQTNVWTRFAFDVIYSQDPEKGSVTLYVDLNGDDDFDDSGERSATIHTNTLKHETRGTDDDGYSEGDSLPSHLRAGIYHNAEIPCPSGCSVDIDNVQVLAP